LSLLMEELPDLRASEGGLVRHLAQRVSNVPHGCLRTRLAIMSVHGLGFKFPRS
jgi:hypothetical protein